MRQKLGLEPAQETRAVLEQLRENESGSNKKVFNKLSEYEMKELVQRGGTGHGFEMQELDEKEKVDRVGGIGFEQRTKQSKGSLNNQDLKKSIDLNQLEGVGIDDLKYLDSRKKLVLLNYLKTKAESDEQVRKEMKKEKKKEKKEKKQKKKEEKKRKRWHSSSSSVSREKDTKKHRDNKKQDINKDKGEDKKNDKKVDKKMDKVDDRHSHDLRRNNRSDEKRQRSRSREHRSRDEHNRKRNNDKRDSHYRGGSNKNEEDRRSRRRRSNSKSSSYSSSLLSE